MFVCTVDICTQKVEKCGDLIMKVCHKSKIDQETLKKKSIDN